MVPNLSPQNLVSIEIGKDFMLSHGYIKNDFDVHEWAAPEFLEQAAKQLLEEEWHDGHDREAPRGDRARRSATPASARPAPSARARRSSASTMTERQGDNDDQTAMQMIAMPEARSGPSPRKAAADELSSRRERSSSTCARPRSGSTATSTARSRPRGAARVLRRPDQPPPQGGARSRPPGHRRVRIGRTGVARGSSRSRTWATRTSPCSTAGSRVGPTPGCRPASTSTRASELDPEA